MKRLKSCFLLGLAALLALPAAAQNTSGVEWVLSPGGEAFTTQALCDTAAKAKVITAETVYDCPRRLRVKPPAPPPVVGTWAKCADERAQCSFAGRYRVRFGDGKAPWVVRVHENGVACSNAIFGDPAYGVTKRCERESVPTTEPLTGSTPAPVDPAPVDPTPTPSDPAASEPATPAPAPGGGTVKPADFGNLPVSGAITARTGQVIEGRRITTASGSCITVPAGVTDVIVRNNEIGPCGQPGDTGAKGVDIQSGASRITVVRNYIHDMATALYANGARHPIIFDRNHVTNIRGPFPRGQMVQFNGVKDGTEPSKVTCNVSDTQGAAYSNVEDHINMFDSGGVGPGALRTEIAYNRLRGGHPTSNSGTAVMVGDGASGGNAWVHDNTVVNVRNVGIGVAGGVGIEVSNNRVFMDRAATYTNVGLYVWSQGGGACSGHTVRNNRAWVNSSNGAQNPWWDGGNCGTVDRSGNVWPDASLTAAMFSEVPAPCR